jgi:8-oxo-dGTP diphosphatase
MYWEYQTASFGIRPTPVSDLGRDKLPTFLDIAWQILFRLGFPVARIWWRLQRRRHVGALVAIHVGQSLLLLRSSYRSAWNFPGGSVRQGETPEVSVRRELAEETGLVANAPLQLLGEVCSVWDGRIDRVFLFVLRLDAFGVAFPPPLFTDALLVINYWILFPTDLSRLRSKLYGLRRRVTNRRMVIGAVVANS